MTMHYRDLDPQARYKLRVVYAGDNFEAKVRLVALADPGPHDQREIEVHPVSTQTAAGQTSRV